MLKAQNGAFYFDGVDDFIKYSPTLKFADLEDVQRGSSVEIIFKIDDLQSGAILISQQSQVTEQVNGLGYNAQGQLYHYLNGEEFLVEGIYFDMNKCYHLSVLYGLATTQYYLNGNLVMVKPALPQQPFLYNDHPFYFGKAPQVQNTHFNGEISEVRLFGDQRTPMEITFYNFSAVGFENDHIFAAFAFNNLYDFSTYGSFGANHVEALLGNGDLEYSPEWVPDHCIPEVESVSASYCQPAPPCNPNNLAPNELLCNGAFEQYCAALRNGHPIWPNPTIPVNFRPHFAFGSYTFQGPSMSGITLSPGSDVPGWEALPRSFDSLHSPDFYVPFGIGSPNGDWSIAGWTSWTGNRPTRNWNGVRDSSGMIGFHTNNTGEAVKTTLVNGQSLLPNRTYTFSGWFYLTRLGSTVSNAVGRIDIGFTNNTNQQYQAGNVSFQYNTSNSPNFGWQFGSITFTTPNAAVLPTGLNTLTLKMNANNSTPNSYIFADNLSLRDESIPNVFPQYTFTGGHNDLHHRIVRVDDNNNVYTVTTVESIGDSTPARIGLTGLDIIGLNTTNKGSIVVKYDQLGNKIWHYFYKEVAIQDLDFDANDDLVAVGHTFRSHSNPSPWLTTFPSGSPSCGTYISGNIQAVFMRMSESDGSITEEFSTGSIHNEWATSVVVIGDSAFVAIDQHLTFCSGNSAIVWTNAFNANGNSQIQGYDLFSNSRFNPNFPPTPTGFDNPKSIKRDGNGGFFVLTETHIYQISSPNSANPVITSSALNTPNPTYLEPKFGTNHAYVLYAGESKVELYDPGTGMINSFSSAIDKAPVAAASWASGDYIMYHQPPSTADVPDHIVVAIEKLDPNGPFGSAIWKKETSGHNTSVMNDYQSFEYTTVGDLAYFENLSGHLAFCGSFSHNLTNINPLTPASWVLQFDNKGLSGVTGYTLGHSFVHTLEDQGSLATFNKNANGLNHSYSDTLSLKDPNAIFVYPNPNSVGLVNIISPCEIKEINIFSTRGEKVKTFKARSKKQELDISTLTPGLYFLEVLSIEGKVYEQLLVE